MASSDDKRIEIVPKAGSLLSRMDQVAIAVILTGCLAVVVWSVWSSGYHQGGLIDIDHSPRWQLDFLVDVNSADWPELSLLPNIGEVLARRIVESREQEGPFDTHQQLLRVPGIGPRTLEAIRPHLAPIADPADLTEP
jgi:competence protein ComEA